MEDDNQNDSKKPKYNSSYNTNKQDANNNYNSNLNYFDESQSINLEKKHNVVNNYYNNNIFVNNIQSNRIMNNNIYYDNNNQMYQINNANNYNNNNNDKASKNKTTHKRNNYVLKNLLCKNNFNNINPDKNNFNQINQYYYNPTQFTEQQNDINKIQNENSTNEIDTNFRTIINDINSNAKKKEIKKNELLFKAFYHVFDEKIEIVKDILTDNLFFQNSCPSAIIDQVKFTINNFSDTEGNVISFRWKKFYILELMCTKTYKSKTQIAYVLNLIDLKPSNIGNLEMTFKYFYNTCQSNTLFIIEYRLDKGILSEVFKEEFLDIDMNEICSSCQKIINLRKKENIHYSSTLINAPKERVMEHILKLNKNKSMKYINEYDILYISKDEDTNNNDNIKKGDVILIQKNNNNILAKIIVEDIKEDKNCNEIIFNCNNYLYLNESKKSTSKEGKEETSEIIQQKISLSFTDITKNISFCEFKHVWNQKISEQKIYVLNFLKNKSLNKYKKDIEQENNDNKNSSSSQKNNFANIFNLLCPIKN